MPKVSVVIPLYNKGEYIKRAINSVLSQTFDDYEIIIINDGSTDDGPEYVFSYSDPRIRLINQDNSGPGAARNRGIYEANGKYVSFLDADDEWLPEFIQKSYDVLEENIDCDVCVSAWYQDFAKCNEIYKKINIVDVYNNLNIHLDYGIINPEKIKHDKYFLHLWFTSAIFMRKSIFSRKYKFFDRIRYTYGEDHFLWIQLAFNHVFYRNSEPLAWYHNNESELASGGYARRELEAFLLWPDEIVERTELKRRKCVRKWIAMYALSSAHSRLGVRQIDNVIKLIKIFPDMFFASPLSFIKLLVKLLLYRLGVYSPCRK